MPAGEPYNPQEHLRSIIMQAAREVIGPLFTKEEWEAMERICLETENCIITGKKAAEEPTCGESDTKAWPPEWTADGNKKEDCDKEKQTSIREIEAKIIAKIDECIGDQEPEIAHEYVETLLKLQQYRQSNDNGY